MMTKWYFRAAAAAIVTHLCVPACSFPAQAPAEILTFPAYCPLKPGAVYTYRVTDTDGNTGVGRVVVGKPIQLPEFNGAITPADGLTRDGLVDGVGYFTSDSTLGFRYHGIADPDCLTRFVPPYRIPNGMKKGEVIEQLTQTTVTALHPNNGVQCGTSTDSSRTTFAGLETVTVPAGTFRNCARVVIEDTSVDDEGFVSQGTVVIDFAPGIGIVKEVDPDPDEGGVVELLSVK